MLQGELRRRGILEENMHAYVNNILKHVIYMSIKKAVLVVGRRYTYAYDRPLRIHMHVEFRGPIRIELRDPCTACDIANAVGHGAGYHGAYEGIEAVCLSLLLF
ncbi:hypothetical protein N9L19_00900 [bacterium]|nr:hypothetical protein [bacterium]